MQNTPNLMSHDVSVYAKQIRGSLRGSQVNPAGEARGAPIHVTAAAMRDDENIREYFSYWCQAWLPTYKDALARSARDLTGNGLIAGPRLVHWVDEPRHRAPFGGFKLRLHVVIDV